MELADIRQRDLESLVDGLGKWHSSERWSEASAFTPSPQLLDSLLYGGVPVQKVVITGVGECVGLLQLAGVNLDDGFGQLEIYLDPDYAVAADDLVKSFVDRLFASYPLRKLILSAAEDELTLPRCVASTAELVGCLRGHRRRNRLEYASICIYEVWSDQWAEIL